MIDYFPFAVHWVLEAEGVLSESSWDDGGVTKYGITKMTLRDYFIRTGQPQEVTDDHIRALDQEFSREVYRVCHWVPPGADRLPWEFALPVFDASVQHAPADAIRILQFAVRAHQDGVFGPETLGKARRAAQNGKTLREALSRFFTYRVENWYLPHADFEHAGTGWLTRAFRTTILAVTEKPFPAT